MAVSEASYISAPFKPSLQKILIVIRCSTQLETRTDTICFFSVIWFAVVTMHQLYNTAYNVARNDKFYSNLKDSFYCKQVRQSVTHKVSFFNA